MLIEQPSVLLRWIYPSAVWRMDPHEKSVYLTFDDGPIPEATPWILDTLDRYGIKATFFMVGENVKKHPNEFAMVKERGHCIGNHTYNHINGMHYQSEFYLQNVDKANELLQTDLLRPPHGWMRWLVYYEMQKRFRIIMWDVVTRDYSQRLTAQDVFNNVKRYTRNGSIITFHDSLKSIEKLKIALPLSLEWLIEQGYTFKTFDIDTK